MLLGLGIIIVIGIIFLIKKIRQKMDPKHQFLEMEKKFAGDK